MSPQDDPIPARVVRLDALIPYSFWASRRIDAVLVCLPKPLAGEGTRRQLQGVIEGLQDCGVPLFYVGPKVNEGSSILASPFIEIPPTNSNPSTFDAVAGALSRFFSDPEHASLQSILVLSMGYTAFGPEGIKRAISHICDFKGRIVCCLVDSAYPDTDAPNNQLTANGWPKSRFYPNAYASTDRIEIVFLLTSSYAYDPRILEARLPGGMSGVGVIAPPYTDTYVNNIVRISSAIKNCRETVRTLIPSMHSFEVDDLIIPIVSSDIWSESAVGNWMTRAQYETCQVGTRNLILALDHVAQRLSCRIWIPMHSTGARFVRDSVPESATVLLGNEALNRGARVVVAGYDYVPQDNHTKLLAISDLAICRTAGQSNASVVLALARTPVFVIDMPARGYMQSEITSSWLTRDVAVMESGDVTVREKNTPLGWRASWRDSHEQLSLVLLDAIENTPERVRRSDAAKRAFESLYSSTTGNLFGLVRTLVGQQ